MRHAGLIELRRHHPDIVGQCTRDLLDDLQAGGMDAVIVGAKNSHPAQVPFSIDSVVVNAPSYPAHAVEANPAIAMETPGNALPQRRSAAARDDHAPCEGEM